MVVKFQLLVSYLRAVRPPQLLRGKQTSKGARESGNTISGLRARVNVPWTCLQCRGFNRLTGCYFTTNPLSFMVSVATSRVLRPPSSSFSLYSHLPARGKAELCHAGHRCHHPSTADKATLKRAAGTDLPDPTAEPLPDPVSQQPQDRRKARKSNLLSTAPSLYTRSSLRQVLTGYTSPASQDKDPFYYFPVSFPHPAQSPKSKDTKQTHPPNAAKTNATKDNV